MPSSCGVYADDSRQERKPCVPRSWNAIIRRREKFSDQAFRQPLRYFLYLLPYHQGDTFLMQGSFHRAKSGDKNLKMSALSSELVKTVVKSGDVFSMCDLASGESIDITMERHGWPGKAHCNGILVAVCRNDFPLKFQDSGKKLFWSQIVMTRPSCYELKKQ